MQQPFFKDSAVPFILSEYDIHLRMENQVGLPVHIFIILPMPFGCFLFPDQDYLRNGHCQNGYE